MLSKRNYKYKRQNPKRKPKHSVEPIVDYRSIRDGIKKIARHINKPSLPDNHDTVMICLLNGAFMFFADLCKHVNIVTQVDFMKVKSYNGQEQGEVEIILDTQLDLKDKRVFVIDDFYDSGTTMNKVLDILSERGPKTLVGATLLKRKNTGISKYRIVHGLYIKSDVWVYGYGMDKENHFARNLKEIYAI